MKICVDYEYMILSVEQTFYELRHTTSNNMKRSNFFPINTEILYQRNKSTQ